MNCFIDYVHVQLVKYSAIVHVNIHVHTCNIMVCLYCKFQSPSDIT